MMLTSAAVGHVEQFSAEDAAVSLRTAALVLMLTVERVDRQSDDFCVCSGWTSSSPLQQTTPDQSTTRRNLKN